MEAVGVEVVRAALSEVEVCSLGAQLVGRAATFLIKGPFETTWLRLDFVVGLLVGQKGEQLLLTLSSLGAMSTAYCVTSVCLLKAPFCLKKVVRRLKKRESNQ